MALTRRQMACFERNPQFLDEVAAAFLVGASAMKRASMVTLSTSESTPVERAFAEIKGRVADQILQAQGINLQAATGLPAMTTNGAQAMSYLVQQLLMSPDWTLTADEWADDELAARAVIQAGVSALMASLTAIPE